MLMAITPVSFRVRHALPGVLHEALASCDCRQCKNALAMNTRFAHGETPRRGFAPNCFFHKNTFLTSIR
jgi:hypothetical protein